MQCFFGKSISGLNLYVYSAIQLVSKRKKINTTNINVVAAIGKKHIRVKKKIKIDKIESITV